MSNMIRKFKTSVTRVNEYEIEIDDSVWTPEELKKWERSFFPTPGLEEFAAHLAASLTKNEGDHGIFIEGFGIVRCLTSLGTALNQVRNKGEFTEGLTVTVIQEEADMDLEVVELKQQLNLNS